MKYCLLILSTILIFASCEKVEEVQSKEDMLRSGKWKIAKNIPFAYRKTPEADTFVVDTIRINQRAECKKDDYLEFRQGIEGALHTAAIKCPDGETEEIDFQYGFLDNDTKFYIYNAGDMFYHTAPHNDVIGTVDEFSNNSIRFSYMIIDNTTHIPREDTVTYTVTLEKF